jgi:hypothetical protein
MSDRAGGQVDLTIILAILQAGIAANVSATFVEHRCSA